MDEFWTGLSGIQKLYGSMLAPICRKHQVTRMELDVLLFLANNPQFDTAKDMVQHRQMTKSHVSLAIGDLCRRNYLIRNYSAGNKKTEHLSLTTAASPVIQDGRAAQGRFIRILFDGFTPADCAVYQKLLNKMLHNILNQMQQEENQDV